MPIIIETENLKPIGLFRTPEDWSYIEAWIERHPAEDRAHLWTAAGMTWNLATSIPKTPVDLFLIETMSQLMRHYLAEVDDYQTLSTTERSIMSETQYNELRDYLKENK